MNYQADETGNTVGPAACVPHAALCGQHRVLWNKPGENSIPLAPLNVLRPDACGVLAVRFWKILLPSAVHLEERLTVSQSVS